MGVYLEKIDEVWCRLHAPIDITTEISAFLTFEVPNAAFIKNRIGNKWDGKIRLLKRPGNKTYIGLTNLIKKYCEERSYEFKTNCLFKTDWAEKSKEIFEQFLKEVQIKIGRKQAALRDYQEEIIKIGIENTRATFLSATSSGKSVCIYALARFYETDLKPNEKILIIVPTINLVEQLVENFKEYSFGTEWDYSKNIFKIYHGQKSNNGHIIISTWQSLYNKPKEYFQNIKVVICDEVHTAKANKIAKLFEKMTNAQFRYGFTGTLDDVPLNRFTICGLFGDVFNIINTSKLIESKQASDLKIIATEINYKQKPNFFKDYQKEIEYLCFNETRNKFICNIASSLKGKTLILVARIKHGELLEKMLKEQLPEREVYFVYGKTPGDVREEIRQQVENSVNSIIVANVQLFAAGIDIKSLSNVILAHPTKSKIRLLQSIGRILRLHPTKKIAKFFDLGDNLRSGGLNNFAYSQFLQRLKLYMKEKLSIDTRRVTI